MTSRASPLEGLLIEAHAQMSELADEAAADEYYYLRDMSEAIFSLKVDLEAARVARETGWKPRAMTAEAAAFVAVARARRDACDQAIRPLPRDELSGLVRKAADYLSPELASACVTAAAMFDASREAGR